MIQQLSITTEQNMHTDTAEQIRLVFDDNCWIIFVSWGDSNEYLQHMFLWRNKQNYPLINYHQIPTLSVPLLIITFVSKFQDEPNNNF